MTNLTIKDLAKTTDLDSNAMAAVHGGMGSKYAEASYGSSYTSTVISPVYTSDSSTHVKQDLFQSQINATGNGSAVFGGSISADNFQLGQNNVYA